MSRFSSLSSTTRTTGRLGGGRLERARATGCGAAATEHLDQAIGRGADALQIRQQGGGVCLRRLPVEGFAGGADAIEWSAQGPAGGREVGRPRLPTRQDLVQQGQQ